MPCSARRPPTGRSRPARPSYLDQADQTQSQLEASQAQVTGQLAVAVANAAAAQAAAAASSHRRRPAGGGPTCRLGRIQLELVGSVGAGTGGGAVLGPVIAAFGRVEAGATTDPALNPFLQCVVQAESGGNYGAVSPNGLYMGAFQFSQSTWNVAAQDAGLPGLVGMPPNAGHQGRPGHAGRGPLRPRRRAAVAGRPLQLEAVARRRQAMLHGGVSGSRAGASVDVGREGRRQRRRHCAVPAHRSQPGPSPRAWARQWVTRSSTMSPRRGCGPSGADTR